ncbi:aldo/keto reductase [Rhodococcus sp. 27YEA15]|uniref:aldo/keto reductase n=1 Tax=Rhodococcus sp. 27YEA15 TaxID=3156259 RepID=UPI003C79C5B4
MRHLGTDRVAALGLGGLGMSEFYGPTDESQSIATIRRAVESGVTLFDTSDVYGHGENERLLGRALAPHREKVQIATKFGVRRADNGIGQEVRGDAAYIKEAVHASLERLGTDHIDIYYQARVDVNTPIEETVGALAELVKAGDIRYIGLSEAAPATIRRAHAVHPITALQTEWSVWSREIEAEIAPTARELGITIIPNAPLGRGFLTGRYRSRDVFDENDFRYLAQPRLSEENFDFNLSLLASFEQLAQSQGVTPGQLALAWLLHQGEDVIPIPGTRRVDHLDENLIAASITLTADEVRQIGDALPAARVRGNKLTDFSLQFVDI